MYGRGIGTTVEVLFLSSQRFGLLCALQMASSLGRCAGVHRPLTRLQTWVTRADTSRYRTSACMVCDDASTVPHRIIQHHMGLHSDAKAQMEPMNAMLHKALGAEQGFHQQQQQPSARLRTTYERIPGTQESPVTFMPGQGSKV